ncbi:hypothetical protein DH2020_004385 [Rehmannia glutinosa]|uniref:UBC core domain-containing protein n=1 Tax=Rehmannia glutinosa TaxID=99300 RepID=A0ABR0XPH0_REHGL
MAEDKYNRKNPAVKRILQEVKEMQSNPSDDFMSLPLEPNGRFETQTKICLSISNHHPEHWQPSWSVRTALVALIAFMPTSPNGALGSLDYPKEERRALAIKSREAAPTSGSSERQKLIDEIHEYMLSKAIPVPQGNQTSEVHTDSEESQQSPQNDVEENTEALSHPAEDDGIIEEPNETPSNANVAQTSQSVPAVPSTGQQLLQKPEPRVQKPADDRLFTWAAVGLTIAIVVLLLKKFLKANGYGAVFMNES